MTNLSSDVIWASEHLRFQRNGTARMAGSMKTGATEFMITGGFKQWGVGKGPGKLVSKRRDSETEQEATERGE